jgi:hypothetical protein
MQTFRCWVIQLRHLARPQNFWLIIRGADKFAAGGVHNIADHIPVIFIVSSHIINALRKIVRCGLQRGQLFNDYIWPMRGKNRHPFSAKFISIRQNGQSLIIQNAVSWAQCLRQLLGVDFGRVRRRARRPAALDRQGAIPSASAAADGQSTADQLNREEFTRHQLGNTYSTYYWASGSPWG